MQISITFPGEPVPASRPRTTRNGHVYTDKHYSCYKQSLATFIHAEYGYFAWDFPKPGDKDRAKWLKKNRYRLSLSVYRRAGAGYWYNFAETVRDALSQAGVIADDCQIHQAEVKLHTDKDKPRLEILLESL